MTGSTAGTGRLFRLITRRDRIRAPLWLVGLGGTIAASAAAVPPIYDTPEKVAGYARAVGTSPVSYLMSGRQAGIDTIGGVVANEISQVAQLGTCLMVVFLVVRHTRTEEETGRAELLRSTVLGRHAAALAALVYGVAMSLVVGAVTAGSMLAVGLDPVGSLTYGVGLALLGLCYVAVGLLAAQLSASGRGALGIAGAAIAVGYLVRGVGAMQDNALVWASPFGWAQRMDAFGREQWWPAVALVAATAALLGLAAWLTAHRDFGSGVLPTRTGRPRAGDLLGTPFGLTVRLQRGLLVGWGAGLTALGLLYGAVLPTIPDLVESNPDIAAAIGASADAEGALTDAFLRYVFLFMAVVSTAFVVTSALRLRSEEETGRTEVVLATGVRRTTVVAASAAFVAVGAVLLTVLMGLGLAVGHALGTGEWDRVGSHLAGQLSYLPAVLLAAAGSIAVVGLRPRWSSAAWGALAVVFLQTLLSDSLRLPGWVDALSPFWHLPDVPVEPWRPGPALVELALAAVLVGVGLWGFRRRDLETG